MEARVKRIISQCSCQQIKRVTRPYGHLPPSLQEYDPWECVQVDLFGSWSYTDTNGIDRSIRAVSFIDVATRWSELHTYNKMKSEEISFIFDQQWLNRYPRPRFVIYDNGTEFSSEFEELLDSFGIIGKPTTVKNPQSNAFVERIHGVIAESLRAMKLHTLPHDDTTNNAILQAIAWGLRSTYHTSLQATPGQFAFGRDMIINSTYLANRRFTRKKQRRNVLCNNSRENRKRVQYDYQPGPNVFILNKDIKRKLNPI